MSAIAGELGLSVSRVSRIVLAQEMLRQLSAGALTSRSVPNG